MELNDVHKAQISRFAAFFKGKRERVFADREREKTDFMSDRMADESAIFNYADIQLLMETYHAQVMGCLREELEKAVDLSAVFIAQILSQAETAGTTLQVDDISIIEDQGRLGEIGALAAMNAPPLAPKPRAQLTAVGSTGNVDPNVLQEIQDVKEENRTMKDRNLQMQNEISTVLRERSVLAAELDQVKANLKQHITRMHEGGGGNVNVAEYERQLTEAKGLHDQKNAELEALRRDMNQRLGDSSQFRELKGIVKKKATEIKDLRQRLIAAGLAPPDAGEGIELEADSD
eukprot:CAMPEP_0168402704 /NCGR_PEP_ID=MMETSP0228-20121227/23755_1 /TAXON_ID=133427 /ORGANISM="Protoceratium reticulatum, Strain CCCM 535 (=CCMP 1889)" /LENGTH=289 /DNA_ID=CAMNT_0008416293 /DNA_START=80 /DNA_END=949 /DNA_ORIENTATION=+